MAKNKLVTYPALITPDENNTFDIEFVDVPEALSFGNSINDAALHGQEALGLALYGRKTLPKATAIESIDKQDNQTIVLISADLNNVKVKEATVRKNVTVPAKLAELADEKGINFSATLSTALKEKLGV
ncbi:type II toxin-antitoxin system HicB family antitoxin [Pediococcus claussenii]|uniref:type II toxin-antitoxin system HicB family antitoxin n=1 Tax=Pediococcus claussenii TaxID=187452 RepID=UPI00081AA537|nr:type II toxin-antitoxin system HicB family antitoxin [Pediococcus claussenii]ANZ70363.1 hypothetical protein AYR57_08560 [Pediococcus claussenii]ANZ72179.1 hypothetical protein AYR58_08560 [Pediococcus claussenii]